MKFKQYLTENDNSIQLSDILRKDCKKYLSMIKGRHVDNILIRESGSSHFENIIPFVIYKGRLNKNREPKGEFEYRAGSFKKLNKILKAMDHIERDKSVSAKVGGTEHGFGKKYFFFPIGDFNFTFVESSDFNDFGTPKDKWNVEVLSSLLAEPDSDDEKTAETINYIKKYVVSNKSFKNALDKHYEIWFDCEEYYMIPDINNNDETIQELMK